MDLSSLSAYIFTCLVIELTPGPNMGFLALVAATRGRRLGFSTVAGIALGLLVVGVLAAAGVATFVDRSEFFYQTLRFGGGAYLLWLALQQWREADKPVLDAQHMSPMVRRYFRYGLTVNLLNPKAALFYIAILPTYLHSNASTESSTIAEAVWLTLIYVSIATTIHISIVLFSSTLQPVFQKEGLRRNTARGFALLLAAIAVWMVWQSARP